MALTNRISPLLEDDNTVEMKALAQAVYDTVMEDVQEQIDHLTKASKSLDLEPRLREFEGEAALFMGKILRKELNQEKQKTLQEVQKNLSTLKNSHEAQIHSLVEGFEKRLASLKQVVESKLEEMQLSYEDRLESVREFIQALPIPQITLPAPIFQPNINLPEQQPIFNVHVPDHNPVFNVHVPEQKAPDVVVHVPKLEQSIVNVTVPEQKAPDVVVNVPHRKTKKKIEYDQYGRPVTIEEED